MFAAGLGFREHVPLPTNPFSREGSRPRRLSDFAKVTQQNSGRAGTDLIPVGWTIMFCPHTRGGGLRVSSVGTGPDVWAWFVERLREGPGGLGTAVCCLGLGVCLAHIQFPWPPPHFLCLISLFQLSPSCLLCSSPEGLSVPVGQLTFGTQAFAPKAAERTTKLLEPTVLLLV